MVKFKYKDVTWAQRKELKKALEAAGVTFRKLAENAEFPIDFVELAFMYGVEGYDDPEPLNELSEVELTIGASEVFANVFIKPEEEKKS